MSATKYNLIFHKLDLALQEKYNVQLLTYWFDEPRCTAFCLAVSPNKEALHMLHIHNAITRNALRDHRGREVKHTGDGIMASFDIAFDAVDCAMATQKAFAAHNQENPDEAMYLRIGISAGEPIEEHGDLFGKAVQLAARVCVHAEPGRILVDELVRDLCPGQEELFSDLGEITPKGFDHAVHLYEVKPGN